MIYKINITLINTHFFQGNICAQLVEHRTGIVRSQVQTLPLFELNALFQIRWKLALCSSDSVQLARFLGEFDYVRLPNPIEVNRTIEFDWLRQDFRCILESTRTTDKIKNVKGKIHRVATFKISKKPMKWQGFPLPENNQIKYGAKCNFLVKTK